MTLKITASKSPENISPETSPKAIRNMERLTTKTAQLLKIDSSSHSTVNWNNARVLSPGKTVGVTTEDGIELCNISTQIFSATTKSGKPDSHGLFQEEGLTVGASVTTGIQTATARNKEKKTTFIQYDKNRIVDKGKDFKVRATREKRIVDKGKDFKVRATREKRIVDKGKDFKVRATREKRKATYEGGHLIDHKYSANNSHTTEANYFPQHFMVNAPIKEYLVKKCDAFLEIPIYTPNPPTIGILNKKDLNHPIPIGEILIQIENNAISAAYYFPNAFDYETLKAELDTKKGIAVTIIPYFQLDPCLYPLFRPAIINSLNQKIQIKNEKSFYKTLIQIMEGMIYFAGDSTADKPNRLAHAVIHKTDIPLTVLLNDSDEKWNQTSLKQSLQKPFNELGKYLIDYAIQNVMKTEVLSIHSRIRFLEALSTFIEDYAGLSEKAQKVINHRLSPLFKEVFEDLKELQPNMSLKEKFQLADVYERLSDPDNQWLEFNDRELFFADTDDFLRNYYILLKAIYGCLCKVNIINIAEDSAEKFLYHIEQFDGYLKLYKKRLELDKDTFEESFEYEIEFLQTIQLFCVKLDKEKFNNKVSSFKNLGCGFNSDTNSES